MRVDDILPRMTRLFLSRTVDSFLKDVHKKDEEYLRQLVLKNRDEFSQAARVEQRLDFIDTERDTAVLDDIILRIVLSEGSYLLAEDVLYERVQDFEKRVVEASHDADLFRSRDKRALQLLTTVLDAAWRRGADLNPHEAYILSVLRRELGLSTYDQYLLEARLGRFPQEGSRLHSTSAIDEALKDLQARGIVMRFKDDKTFYVIPEEIARTVRLTLGVELRENAFQRLLNDLALQQLKTILGYVGLPTSGAKAELVERVVSSREKPSRLLNALHIDEITSMLRPLRGAKVSGSKEEKILNLIDYYEGLSSKEPSDPTDPRSIFYDWFELLAERRYINLRSNQVIQKDKDVDRAFEEATRYLFERKLGLTLVDLPGTDRPDGAIDFQEREFILWDNKSCEGLYGLPEDHFQQFLRYIRKSPKAVTLFMVIAPDFEPGALTAAQKLKVFSEQDTDVALITARDLKFMAEHWREYSTRKVPSFNPKVLDLTGFLTRDVLIDRLGWVEF